MLIGQVARVVDLEALLSLIDSRIPAVIYAVVSAVVPELVASFVAQDVVSKTAAANEIQRISVFVCWEVLMRIHRGGFLR